MNSNIRALRGSVSVSAMIVALAAAIPSASIAGSLPQHGQYVAGSGSMQYWGSGLIIDQSSTRGIIDWQSFSIGQGELVQFDNGSGATLNEVTGGNLSQIAGSLKATGSVYLVNPSGVIITPTGQVITQGSFVASTRNVDNSAFMSGSGLEFSGSSSGNVTNEGSVTSANGDVVLFGDNSRTAQYSNTNAANGTVAVIAGDNLYYKPGGENELLVKGGKGNATNHGTIKAAQAELAAAGGNVYAMAGTNAGVIQATGTATINGHVWLVAGNQTQISGTTSARNADGSGGTIIATGNSVNVANKATISADGSTGGSVLIGGDQHGGSDPSEDLVSQYVPDAQTTNITAGATISANGTDGAGGDIVVWSKKRTNFKGKIDARGSKGGAGGNAEVSSHEVLAFGGHVDLTSFGGPTGNLLLDPSNVTISSSGTTQGEQVVFGIGGYTFEPTSGTSDINVSTLENDLSYANVTVSTTSTYSDAGNISVMSPLTWSAHTLTLDAAKSIYFAAPVRVMGTGGLALVTNDCNTCSGGDYYFTSAGAYVTFANLDESLMINNVPYKLVDTVQELASAVSGDPSGFIALAQSYDASQDGTYQTEPVPTPFVGVFEGLGNTISGLSITSDDSAVGLFATIQNPATIRDLILAGPSVVGEGGGLDAYVGSLVGQDNGGQLLSDTVTNDTGRGATVSYTGSAVVYIGGLVGDIVGGTINNSVVEGQPVPDVSNDFISGGATVFAGGLAGASQGATVQNSSFDGSVMGYEPTDIEAGGLIGLATTNPNNGNPTAVMNSFAIGSVEGSLPMCLEQCVQQVNIGGLIGYLTGSGTVTSSYAASDVVVGLVSGSSGNEGGLVGWADSGTSISGSYASGWVTGNGTSVGGLVGLNDGMISTSYANQSGAGPLVTTTGTVASVGGLVGVNNGSISTSSADQSGTGPLVTSSGSNANVGGLVGQNNSTGMISQSFAAPIEGENTYAIFGGDGSSVGGLVGYNNGMIGNSYSYPTFSTGVCSNNCSALIVGGTSSTIVSNVGGLVGYADSNSTITSSYSTGSVESSDSSSNLGGSIGFDYNLGVNGTKQNVYWDTTTSGTSHAAGNNGGSSDLGITGRTTTQLESGLPSGFDSSIWAELSNSLPCLIGVTGGCGD